MPQSRRINRRRRPRSSRARRTNRAQPTGMALSQLTPAPAVSDPRIISMRGNKVYTFRQSIITVVTSSTTVDTAGALVYTLSSLPDVSSYSAVFDAWRILQVTTKWTPFGPNQIGVILTAVDYDDGNVPSSAGVMAQYDTNKISTANLFFQRTFNPRAALAAYSGAFTSYAQASRSTWYDVASPGVQFFGLKYYVPVTSNAISWYVSQDITVQFKSVR